MNDAHQTSTRSATASVATIQVKIPRSPLGDKHSEFDDFLAELQADPENASAFAKAGEWIADEFYAGEGTTLRTTRLRKGLSQKQLAEKIGTSQPHVAIIEKGGCEIMLHTAVRLAAALDIDLNELPAMLEAQRSKPTIKVLK